MWPRFVSTAIGVWLYAAPSVLDYGGAAETSDRIVGPLIISFSFVAIWEHLRGVRLANRPLAVWLIVSPLFLGHPTWAFVSTVASGAAVLGLTFLGGRVERPFGGGWRAVLPERHRRRLPG